MILKMVAHAACDEHDNGRACTEFATVERQASNDVTAELFEILAKDALKAQGWQFSGCFTFCPGHAKKSS